MKEDAGMDDVVDGGLAHLDANLCSLSAPADHHILVEILNSDG